MTKKVDTWMPLLVDKYLGDTTHLTTEQHGAYLLLLMSMWKKDGHLQDNDQQLAQIAKVSPGKWRALRPILIDGLLLRIEDGRVVQKRLTAELAQAKGVSNKKAEAGAKGAAKRWGNGSNSDGKPDGRSDGTAIAEPWQSQWQTDAPIPIPIQGNTEDFSLPGGDSAGLPEPGGTAYGAMSLRVRRELLIPDCTPGHLGFKALVDAGATFEEFAAYAEKARGMGKPFAYLVTTLTNERAKVKAAAGQMHRGPLHAAPAADAWTHKRAEVVNRGCQLGLGPWDEYASHHGGETFETYRRRVIDADRQHAGAPA